MKSVRKYFHPCSADEYKEKVLPKLHAMQADFVSYFYSKAERGADGRIPYFEKEDIGPTRVFRIGRRSISFQSLSRGKRWLIPSLEGCMISISFGLYTVEDVSGGGFRRLYLGRHMITFGWKKYKAF